MRKAFYILDERDAWHAAAVAAARRRGWRAERVWRGDEVEGHEGFGFIRPHAHPAVLPGNQERDDVIMRTWLTMVQDRAQVVVYDNKTEQFKRWGRFMPETYLATDLDATIAWLEARQHDILVGKADVGASSKNVTILDGLDAQIGYVRRVFTDGITVDHCCGGSARAKYGHSQSVQKGHVLLQRFISHDCTWRVNRIGTRLAAFRRFNYPDRAVAQTGNVEPVMHEVPELFEFANQVFDALDTYWCAIDVLKDGDEWKLLETSLAWPWPSPGTCMDAPFFGTNRRWGGIWDLLFDEIEAGVWGG